MRTINDDLSVDNLRQFYHDIDSDNVAQQQRNSEVRGTTNLKSSVIF